MRADPAARAERSMHGTSSSGRLIVLALLDASTGKRVAAAQVIAAVTSWGGATTRKRLEPMTDGGVASFGNCFALAEPDTTRVVFEVERLGRRYARWCVTRMTDDARRAFAAPRARSP